MSKILSLKSGFTLEILHKSTWNKCYDIRKARYESALPVAQNAMNEYIIQKCLKVQNFNLK